MSLLDTAIACAACNKNAYQYTYGVLEPNFTVPAIRYQVEIQPDRVILWNKSLWNYWTMDYLAIQTICKGLLGECVNCTWPDCEH